MSNVALKDEARRVAIELDLREFKGSEGWLTNWKRRFNVGLRRKTIESQALPENCQDVLLGFRRHIIHLREKYEYSLYNVTNMDETIVRDRYDSVANITNNVRGEMKNQNTRYGLPNERVHCRSDGNSQRSQAIPPLIIFKEPTRNRPMHEAAFKHSRLTSVSLHQRAVG